MILGKICGAPVIRYSQSSPVLDVLVGMQGGAERGIALNKKAQKTSRRQAATAASVQTD